MKRVLTPSLFITYPPNSKSTKGIYSEELSTQEMEETLKTIKKSDFKIIEKLGQTPSKISMLSLLLCSDAHAQALIKFFKKAHVHQETTTDQF